jgi:hypothetical protein
MIEGGTLQMKSSETPFTATGEKTTKSLFSAGIQPDISWVKTPKPVGFSLRNVALIPIFND